MRHRDDVGLQTLPAVAMLSKSDMAVILFSFKKICGEASDHIEGTIVICSEMTTNRIHSLPAPIELFGSQDVASKLYKCWSQKPHLALY